ncbi:MAG: hypothetical protein SFU86_03610 [Pirellulaceae bacterium]|nr:hypothetical protein [Pirellulaceae bacterium]
MFSEPWQWILAGGIVAAVGLAILLLWSRRPRAASIERARKLFHLRRELLEHKFFVLASQSGKPRGLEWVDVDFEDEVAFARDRQTRQLRAFVGVTIRFRAIEGGGMEDNPNVSNLRAATAVFQLDGSEWSTEARVIFNLNPAQAIRHFPQELELVE